MTITSHKSIKNANPTKEYLLVVLIKLGEISYSLKSLKFLSISPFAPVNTTTFFLSFKRNEIQFLNPSYVHFFSGKVGPQPVFNKIILESF